MRSIHASEKILFCFDADQTLFFGHLHNYLWRALDNPLNTLTQEALVAQFHQSPERSFKDKAGILKLFRSILAQGHGLAITSYNDFPGSLEQSLKILGLTEDEREQIAVIAYLPDSQSQILIGKNQHIQDADNVFFNNNVLTSVSVLIDDSPNNIDKAMNIGHLVLQEPVQGHVSWDGQASAGFIKPLEQFLQMHQSGLISVHDNPYEYEFNHITSIIHRQNPLCQTMEISLENGDFEAFEDNRLEVAPSNATQSSQASVGYFPSYPLFSPISSFPAFPSYLNDGAEQNPLAQAMEIDLEPFGSDDDDLDVDGDVGTQTQAVQVISLRDTQPNIDFLLNSPPNRDTLVQSAPVKFQSVDAQDTGIEPPVKPYGPGLGRSQ